MSYVRMHGCVKVGTGLEEGEGGCDCVLTETCMGVFMFMITCVYNAVSCLCV